MEAVRLGLRGHPAAMRSTLRNNRSVPECGVIPVLRYPDPSVAAAWLEVAFGFTVRLRIANHRIQMRAGQGCLTVAEGDAIPNQSCGGPGRRF